MDRICRQHHLLGGLLHAARRAGLLPILLGLCCFLILAGCQRGRATPPSTPTPTATPAVAAQPPSLTGPTGEAETENAPSDTPTPQTDAGSIVLWHSWSGADADALAQILRQFRQKHPEIDVQTLFVAYNRLPQSYADAVYAGGGPDLVLAPNWWLQDLADVGVLLPLDDRIDPALLDQYHPAAVENLTYQGTLYGLPTNFELVSLYYNSALAPEGPPATTDAWLALAQRDPTLGGGLYANLYHMFWGIPAYGGELFDAEGRVILDQTPGTAAFLAWLHAMQETPGGYVDLDYGMLIDRFKKGEYAFFIDGPWSMAELREALGDDLAVGSLPAGPAGPARPWLSADGVFLNPVVDEAQQRMALRLATHVTSVESETLLAQIANRIPAHVDAQIDDPLLRGFAQQATTALPEPHRPEMDEVWGYAGDMILKVLNDVLPPEKAVIEAATLINEANDR